jgi:uncharacterized protein (DUF2147 family)
MWKLAAGAVLAAVLFGTARAAERPEGFWVSQSGNVEVQIGACGQALCGRVVRVMANHSMGGPGGSAAPPAQVGQVLMSDFAPSGEGQWTGHLFNREDGRTYDCVLTPAGRTMEVRAYLFFPIFGKSQTWTRVG